MRLCLYAHAFDLQALAPIGGLARLRDLGFDEIALAASYHDGRWLQPWHPAGRVRFLEDGTVHFRPRAEYGTLRPVASSTVPPEGASPLEQLCRDAAAAGLRVRAWTVFTHNSRLGALHPDRCVQNAFGDRYVYALCPAQPAVQQYVVAMVKDLAAHAGLHTIEFEALGQMGWQHSSHHDKASFAPSGLLDLALSACFCAACTQQLAAVGADPAVVREKARAEVEQDIGQSDAMAPHWVPTGPQHVVPGQWFDSVLAARARTMRQVIAGVLEATPATARAVQVHPHPWFTGSQLAANAAAFPADDERVLTCYGLSPDAIGKLLAHDGMQTIAASPKRVCIWPKAPQFTSEEDLQRLAATCAQHGVASLAIYHLGLLPWRTLERVAMVFP